jgi:hypothetical protein
MSWTDIVSTAEQYQLATTAPRLLAIAIVYVQLSDSMTVIS